MCAQDDPCSKPLQSKKIIEFITVVILFCLASIQILFIITWRLPSISELIPYKISLELTHLGLEASIWSNT